jgi:hypothetical protein
MAALATGDLEPTTIQHLEEPEVQAHELGSTALLDIVRACLHASSAEWIFLRELRVGTGFRNGAAQRLDAFALFPGYILSLLASRRRPICQIQLNWRAVWSESIGFTHRLGGS